MYDPSYNIGMLLSFYIGNHWDCVDQIKMQLITPIIFILVLLFLPESPEHHIKQNNEKVQYNSINSSLIAIYLNHLNLPNSNLLQRAIKSQKFFRGKHSVADKMQFKSVPTDEFIASDKTEIKGDTNSDTSRFKLVSTDECVETGVTKPTDNLTLSDFRMYTIPL